MDLDKKTTQNNERSDYVLCRPRRLTGRKAIGDPGIKLCSISKIT